MLSLRFWEEPGPTVTSLNGLSGSDAVVVGISAEDLQKEEPCGDSTSLTLINTHCIDDGSAPEDALTERCDYEFLYHKGPFLRRDLTRFLALILGQTIPHEELAKK